MAKKRKSRKYTTIENWKGRAVFVRYEKGQKVSWKYKKGSGISSIKEANEIYRENQNFDKTKITIKSDFRPRTINITKNHLGFKQLGRNTGLFITEQPIKNNEHYQIVAIVKWGARKKETKGYSDLIFNYISKEEAKQHAFDRALGTAISDKIAGLSYEYDQNWIDDKSGYMTKDKKAVYFEVEYYIQTFIMTREEEQ